MKTRRLTDRLLDATLTALSRVNADDLSQLDEDKQQALADAEAYFGLLLARRALRKRAKKGKS